jgi:hypothetical protein
MALAIGLLAVGAAPTIAAQATTVTLQGTITGSDVSSPEGAQIEVRSRETGAARGALADKAGIYRLLGLTPGIYDVTVRAIGYRQQRHEGVRLVLGQRALLDFTLESGAVELEWTVQCRDGGGHERDRRATGRCDAALRTLCDNTDRGEQRIELRKLAPDRLVVGTLVCFGNADEGA